MYTHTFTCRQDVEEGEELLRKWKICTYNIFHFRIICNRYHIIISIFGDYYSMECSNSP